MHKRRELCIYIYIKKTSNTAKQACERIGAWLERKRITNGCDGMYVCMHTYIHAYSLFINLIHDPWI